MHFNDKEYCVYILSNRKGGTLYIGVTSDLQGRIWEHKESGCKGFSSKYKTNKLIYYEIFNDINEAINR